ncbi:hypothetical protein RchiOBHm_Chr2g0140931 [Rosa chinensis]|uniref:Uncharacterized protein n=1 Tax=Rosa chinensis TaxID=74649 RepID=A0A2P6RXF9_ROSCH|nr:hypothetical protein RchiOBHm_Chr2g0140931 [Rosa chinensis]
MDGTTTSATVKVVVHVLSSRTLRLIQTHIPLLHGQLAQHGQMGFLAPGHNGVLIATLISMD